MKGFKWFFLLAAFILPTTLYADFIEKNLFVVNRPSTISDEYDSIIELSPQGRYQNTLISKDLQIYGMKDAAFDPVTGHLFYTVMNWGEKIFEIREVDDSGGLIHTYTHSDFDSFNAPMVFNRSGDLFIINDGHLYVKKFGSAVISKEIKVPMINIGDLEIDSRGNLFLSDSHVYDIIYKIELNETVTTFADHNDGINSPSGMAMDSQDNLYVANSIYTPAGWGSTIIKLDPSGNAEVFSNDNNLPCLGIEDMIFNADGELFASCKNEHTIIKFDSLGNFTVFADADDGLETPMSLEFIAYPVACPIDADTDGDTDGSDLAHFAANFNSDCISSVADAFGG